MRRAGRSDVNKLITGFPGSNIIYLPLGMEINYVFGAKLDRDHYNLNVAPKSERGTVSHSMFCFGHQMEFDNILLTFQ